MLIYEQAFGGSTLQKGVLLSDTSIKKKNVWTIDKFDVATGRILWQYARKGIVDQEEYTGYGSKLIHDKEGNVTLVWSLNQAPYFTVLKIAAKEGTALWETKIGK